MQRMRSNVVLLWFIVQSITYPLSMSSLLGDYKKLSPWPSQLTESLLDSSSVTHCHPGPTRCRLHPDYFKNTRVYSGLSEATETNPGESEITSELAHHWLHVMKSATPQFLSKWLLLYYRRSKDVIRYPIRLEQVGFLDSLSKAYENHINKKTIQNRIALVSSLDEAFKAISEMDETKADSQIKIGTLLGFFAEMTQIERDIPSDSSRSIEDVLRPKIYALHRRTLKDQSSMLRNLSEELLKLWRRRKGKSAELGLNPIKPDSDPVEYTEEHIGSGQANTCTAQNHRTLQLE